jgi:hypothetical protein
VTLHTRDTARMPPAAYRAHRARYLARRRLVTTAFVLLAAACAWPFTPASKEVSGRTLLYLSHSHGLDVGDLVALPVLALSAWLFILSARRGTIEAASQQPRSV